LIKETPFAGSPVRSGGRPDGEGGRPGTAVPLTRIFIDRDGNLVVTDLWEEVSRLVGEAEGEHCQ
jgi:hypothetical protein